MKKTLIIAGLVAFLATVNTTYAATADNAAPVKNQVKQEKIKKQKQQRPNFDERLKLTEEQKTKAHEIRMQGHEKIKPIMEKIKAKHSEIGNILEDKTLSQEQKDKKLEAVEKELLNLKQQARRIRTENMKEFESILTDEQKSELEKIKEEGRAMRAKMLKEHKGSHMPMQGGEAPVRK